MKFDIVIHNALIVTVNPDFDIIKNGVIGIRDGLIERVQEGGKDVSAFPASEYIDAGGGIVMPGLVNVHTHLPMSLFRGLADDLPLAEWLNDHIFPAESRYITPETARIGALLSCLEMLLSGTTTCCDGYFFEDEVAEAISLSGIRAVAGQGVIDFPAPGVPDPSRNVEMAAAFVEKWKHRSPLVTPSIFCHSPYTCSAETLKKAKQAADRLGVLFQIHVAETKYERNQSLAATGLTPVAYLDSLGMLDENTLAVHAVWVDEDDLDILARLGVKIAHAPESNMKLASGVAPVPRMLEKGLSVGLGTDGCASNNNLDLFGEMDMAAKLHKVTAFDPTVMNARTVVRMATTMGARAIGLGDRIGSLEPGKQADIIIIDTRKPHLTPMYHPESHLVYAVRGADVRDVLVAGRVLVRDYRPVDLDVVATLQNARYVGEKVKADGRLAGPGLSNQ
ncbi:MAG: amidohydrolase [Desulfosalsimonadaceae bacterium]|nr:amidohydrolase [Desulfosalsimonadaceae bacterium]